MIVIKNKGDCLVNHSVLLDPLRQFGRFIATFKSFQGRLP